MHDVISCKIFSFFFLQPDKISPDGIVDTLQVMVNNIILTLFIVVLSDDESNVTALLS